MEEVVLQSQNKRNIWIIIISVVVVAGGAAFFYGPTWAASYFFNKGYEYHFKDNVGGTYFKEAAANFSRSLKFDSKNPVAHMYLGREELGRVDEFSSEYYPDAIWASAIQHYKLALDFGIKNTNDSFYAHTLEHLGLSYLKIEQHENAREAYLEKINAFPNSFFGVKSFSTFWARFLTAEMDFKFLNKPEEALAILAPLAKPENSDPENLFRVYTLLSRLHVYFLDWESALNAAGLALKNAPDEPHNDIRTAHTQLAVVFGQKKDFGRMETELKNAKSLGLSEGDIRCLRAISYFLGESYAKSIEQAKSSAGASPYLQSICLAALGMSYDELENVSEAKKYYQEYLNLTETFKEKNIFVMRYREMFSKDLSE